MYDYVWLCMTMYDYVWLHIFFCSTKRHMTNSPRAPSTASRAFYTRTVGHSSILGGGTKVQCSTSRTAQLIVPDTPAPRAYLGSVPAQIRLAIGHIYIPRPWPWPGILSHPPPRTVWTCSARLWGRSSCWLSVKPSSSHSLGIAAGGSESPPGSCWQSEEWWSRSPQWTAVVGTTATTGTPGSTGP